MASDGQGFFDKHKGEDHQRKLGNGEKLEPFKFEDSDFGKAVIAKKGKKTESKKTESKKTDPKKLSKMNKTELLEVVKAEEVPDVNKDTTNPDLVKAIEAKRAEVTKAAKGSEVTE